MKRHIMTNLNKNVHGNLRFFKKKVVANNNPFDQVKFKWFLHFRNNFDTAPLSRKEKQNRQREDMADFMTSTHKAEWIFTPQDIVSVQSFGGYHFPFSFSHLYFEFLVYSVHRNISIRLLIKERNQHQRRYASSIAQFF